MHGCQMLLMWKNSCLPPTSLMKPRKRLYDMQMVLCPLVIQLFCQMEATWMMHQLQRLTPHVCNQVYTEVEDFDQDLSDLIATCQQHTQCSAAYCLCTRHGQQECHFGYPKPLQPRTAIVVEDDSQPGQHY